MTVLRDADTSSRRRATARFTSSDVPPQRPIRGLRLYARARSTAFRSRSYRLVLDYPSPTARNHFAAIDDKRPVVPKRSARDTKKPRERVGENVDRMSRAYDYTLFRICRDDDIRDELATLNPYAVENRW